MVNEAHIYVACAPGFDGPGVFVHNKDGFGLVNLKTYDVAEEAIDVTTVAGKALASGAWAQGASRRLQIPQWSTSRSMAGKSALPRYQYVRKALGLRQTFAELRSQPSLANPRRHSLQ